jgi:hypothetical protein
LPATDAASASVNAAHGPFSEAAIRLEIARRGPLQAYRTLVSGNDALIRRVDLSCGQRIVEERSRIHTELVRHWAAEQHRRSGYDKAFAVVALGGTGRAEVAPASDLDFAFLFDDALDGNDFLLSLQSQLLETSEFRASHGFGFEPLPFNLDDAPRLTGKQLNSFLDLRPVYDPTNLADRFRKRIRATYDPFEHFLHVRGFWLGQWEKAAAEVERLDRFDIKNDGLRVFLAGIWTLAGKHFSHGHEIYRSLEDPRDLEAYYLLIRVRCFLHLRHATMRERRGGGNHAQDIVGFDDFTSFGEMLGPEATDKARFEFENEVRTRILWARRRVARFTKTIIERELAEGREASPGVKAIYRIGGLQSLAARGCQTPEEKSRAALLLLLASQRHGVPIDPAEMHMTFRNAGDWLVLVPELATLFYEQRGSLADSFGFLSQFEGAEDRLFPGYSRFEASLDGRIMAERTWLRGALERQKMRTLEQFVREGQQKLSQAVSPQRLTDVSREIDIAIEAARLDADHLAAVKLALKTKRLPLTPEDQTVRGDESRPLHERLSTGTSEIPLGDYFLPYRAAGGFPEETVRIAQKLIALRRAFKERADSPNDAQQVREFAELCGDEEFLRALFVFTCADRAHWESESDDPARWFNSRELYYKAMMRFRPGLDPAAHLWRLGYSEQESGILRDFGEAFWGGEYRQYASAFASSLVSLADKHSPGDCRVILLSGGAGPILGVAARDYRGLAASITGALWRQGMNLRQAHLFSATRYGLALDFFHVPPGGKPWGRDVFRAIEEAIRGQLHIAEDLELDLPRLQGRATLREWRPGQFCLRHETRMEAGGLVYALCYKVFQHLRGNIFGLVAHASRGSAYVSVYHSLPPGLALSQAQEIVSAWT